MLNSASKETNTLNEGKVSKLRKYIPQLLTVIALLVQPYISDISNLSKVTKANVTTQHRTYIPLVSSPPAKPLSSFIGVNQGPGAGNNGGYYPGNLDNPYLLPNNMEMIQRAGIDRVRQYSSDNIIYAWNWNETSPGVYDWSKWDLFFKSAREAGVKVAPSIGNGVPFWASETTDWKAMPTDLFAPLSENSWAKYIDAFVRRYYADLDLLEIWNEPDYKRGGVPAQFNGTVDDYIQMVKVAKDVLGSIDIEKKIKLVAPSSICGIGLNCSTSQSWSLDEFLIKSRNVLSNSFYISFHGYSSEAGVMWDLNGTDNYLTLTNDKAKTYGVKVLWNETGYTGSDENMKASYIVVSQIIGMHKSEFMGVYWYPFTESKNYTTPRSKRMIEVTSGSGSIGNEPNPYGYPIFTASEVFKNILKDFTIDNRPVKLNTPSNYVLYKLTNTLGKEVFVYWLNSTTPQPFSLGNLGKRMVEVDLYGNYLGDYTGTVTATVQPKYLTSDITWNPNRAKISGRLSTNDISWNNGISDTLIRAINSQGMVYTVTTESDGSFYYSYLSSSNYTVTPILDPTNNLSHTGILSPAYQVITSNVNGSSFGGISFKIVSP